VRRALAGSGIVHVQVSDRRYSTSAWQRTRKAILRRDGYVCRIQGPRCTGRATTVHHVIPSSQRPDLFWSAENLVSACGRCNYGGGARIQAENRRLQTEQLYEIIESQQAQIEQLLERLAQYENPAPTAIATNPRNPAIY
jgi:5-methylcytosine-specific restriction endonuclease McrA